MNAKKLALFGASAVVLGGVLVYALGIFPPASGRDGQGTIGQRNVYRAAQPADATVDPNNAPVAANASLVKDQDTTELQNGQMYQMNGQMYQMQNGQMVALQNGQMYQMNNGVKVQMQNGELHVQMNNGQFVHQMNNGQFVHQLNNGQMVAFNGVHFQLNNGQMLALQNGLKVQMQSGQMQNQMQNGFAHK